MDTTETTQANTVKLNQIQIVSVKKGWLAKQEQSFEKARFGWMAMYITIQSCLGSIAAALLLENHASDILLSLCAVITMLSNSIFIAQASAKLCLLTFYASVVVNTILILMNF